MLAEAREVLVDRRELDLHSAVSTRSSSAMSSSETSSPSRSIALGAGTLPIGVSTASAVPSQRRKTQASTRLFSPKPGQRNFPSSSLRNQLT